MKTKRCTVCKRVKTFSLYNKNRKAHDGHQSRCRSCDKKSRGVKLKDLGFSWKFYGDEA